MELIRQALLYSHIVAGFASIFLFWLPVFSKKGGLTHRKVGGYYVKLMWVVVVTAALLCLIRLYQGNLVGAVFLGFLALLTANPLWHAVAALDQKRSTSRSFRRKSLSFELLLGLCGVALILFALSLQQGGDRILMMIFGSIGSISLIRVIPLILKPAEDIDWMKEHIQGICISGIAAYTAFFSFGGAVWFRAVLPGNLMVVPWILPTIIGFIGIAYAIRKYVKPRRQKSAAV